MKRTWLLPALGTASLSMLQSPVSAADSIGWAAEGARTLSQGGIEVGVISDSRVGITPRLELRAQPLGFLVFPHAEGKFLWVQSANWLFSSRHRVAYPSLFLNLLAKEGALGLFPARTHIPQALLLGNHGVLSYEFEAPHTLSFTLGATVAPRSRDLPVLEFPFLYQRLAALYGWVVPDFAWTLEGELPWDFGYAVAAQLFWFALPGEQTGGLQNSWAYEGSARLDHYLGQRARVSVSLHAAHSEFPFGARTHLLPLVDARFKF